jgi:ribosome maturation protein SDO1
MAVQKEGDSFVDDLADVANTSRSSPSQVASGGDVSTSEKDIPRLESLSLQTGQTTRALATKEKKQRCNTCDAEVLDAAQYREHFKSEWHKHNLKRKVKQLPPVSSDEWMLDTEIVGGTNDSNEYSR